MNMPHSFGSVGGLALGDSPPPARPNGTKPVPISIASSAGERCWPVRPTLRNELDTFSVHFYIFFGPNVSVPPDRPAVFVINLLPVLDSGGVLNLELRLNVVRWPRCARDGAGQPRVGQAGRWVMSRLQQGKEQDLGCSWFPGHGLGALG